jgi:hypothetical protein
MKRLIASLAMATCLLLPSAGVVFGGSQNAGSVTPPGTKNQPGTTAGFNCGTSTALVEPGLASASPGAPFNETLPGQAGTVYAGNQGTASAAHAASTAAVSQYDAACHQLSIK